MDVVKSGGHDRDETQWWGTAHMSGGSVSEHALLAWPEGCSDLMLHTPPLHAWSYWCTHPYMHAHTRGSRFTGRSEPYLAQELLNRGSALGSIRLFGPRASEGGMLAHLCIYVPRCYTRL